MSGLDIVFNSSPGFFQCHDALTPTTTLLPGTIIGKVGNEYAVQFEGAPADLDGAHHQARRRRGAAPEIVGFFQKSSSCRPA